MKELIQRPHIILSVENPVDPSKAKRPVSHDVALKALERAGKGKVVALKGSFDNKPEQSILISDPDETQTALARKLASDTGQHSYIESDGYSHKMISGEGPHAGEVIHGKGTTFYSEKPKDMYSTLPDGTHFIHNFNFEKSEKPFHGYNPKKHAKTGGLNDKERKRINREEGRNLKRPQPEGGARKKSFCARMSGVKGPTSKGGKLTPKGAALKRWKCSKSEEHIPGGIASKEDIKKLPKDLLDQGTKVEMEHTSDPNIAREIAADHLMEDRHYYSKLSELEKSKNVREQRAKVFGTDPNAPRTSERRMKMMQRIRDYAEKKYGLPLVTASGKRDESGEVRDEGYQKPYDVFTPKGVAQEKKYLEQLKEQGEKRTDPKPDWRSGQLETQPSPDAAVHELAHLDLAPESMTAPEFQSEMDRRWGESQSKYGHMQQKRTQGEIQPMAVENPIRRELGLPANRATKPVKEQEYALDDPSQPRFVEGLDPKGRKAFYDRQSRLQSPETRERREAVSSGTLKFHPERGWYKATDPNALISLRAQGKPEEAVSRQKERYGLKDKKMAASEEPLMKPYHSEAQRRWAHTSAGTKALGGKKAVKEWDESSRGLKLPEKAVKSVPDACDCDLEKGTIGPKCKERFKSYQSSLNKKDRCWEGYEPTPGKKPYSKGSCRPIKKGEIKKAWTLSVNKNPDPSKQSINFSHPEHGTVSVIKQSGMYHVRHNGGIAGMMGHKGVYPDLKSAVAHANNYTKGVESGKIQGKTSMNMPSLPGSSSLGKSDPGSWTHKGYTFSETTHPKTPAGHKAYSLTHQQSGKTDILFARSPEEVGKHIDRVTWKPKWFQEESDTKKNVGSAPGRDPMSPFNKKG